jgi:hypothetical protein
MHFVDDYKFRMNIEVIIIQIGLDVSQNLEVVIVKKQDATNPHKIQIYKSENGHNAVFKSCIPFWNTGDGVK